MSTSLTIIAIPFFRTVKAGEPHEVFFSPLTDEAGIFLFRDRRGRNCFVRDRRGRTRLHFGNPHNEVGYFC